MVEIKYGRTIVDGKPCGYATWMEDGHKMEFVDIPNMRLVKLVDNKRVELTEQDIMLWTKIAGWLGTEELYKEWSYKLKQGRY